MLQVQCPHCQSPVTLNPALPCPPVDLASSQLSLTASGQTPLPASGSSLALDGEFPSESLAAPGARRLGRFELHEVVGEGSFGTVYRGRDTDLDRVVAVKVPRGQAASGPGRELFLREARSVAHLRHPAIVPVYEIGQSGAVPFLVMEYKSGVSLADLLTARRPDVKETARIIAGVADALHYAHEQGVVHRDVKPSNILLDDQGVPHLTDFGLAKAPALDLAPASDKMVGTIAYMSPEQVRGDATIDGRSDVYSLGVVLYQLLTGRRPFHGNTRMLLYQVQHEDPPPPRSLDGCVPPELERICLRATAKDVAHRYPTAADLAADLRRFLATPPVPAAPLMPPPPRPEPPRSLLQTNAGRMLLIVLLSAGMGAVAALVGYSFLHADSGRELPPTGEWQQLSQPVSRKIADEPTRHSDLVPVVRPPHVEGDKHLAPNEKSAGEPWDVVEPGLVKDLSRPDK